MRDYRCIGPVLGARLALAGCVVMGGGGAACHRVPLPTAEYLEAYDRGARLEREERPLKAAGAYGEAAGRAGRERSRWQAEYRQARELEKGGRRTAAQRMYLAIAEAAPEGEMAPRCLYYAARMAQEDGDHETALERLRAVIERYPDNGLAPQAVRRAVQWLEARGEGDRALELLVELEEGLRGRDVGDTLLYRRAHLEEERGRWEVALEIYERMVELHPYPGSTLYDDALWEAGNLALEHGQPARAIRYLEQLVGHRDGAWIFGSNVTHFTDDAQLLIGRIHLEHLGDLAAAVRELEVLATFPDSILADDGLWWASRARMLRGDQRGSCRVLARLLRDFPDSNQRRRAAAARTEQGCEGR